MFLNALIVAAGFVFLVKGADMLVAGASSLAKKLGVSTLLVGLTVVALGTSMPELAVNVFAALKGTTDIAVGNIIGSNIANIALVLGLSAALFPLRVQHSTTWKEIPYALLAVILVVIMASDVVFDHASSDALGRGDGFVLLSFTIIFLYYVFGMAKSGKADLGDVPKMGAGRIAVFILVGILMLVAGGKAVIEGAVGFAEAVGMSSRVIGLTVVALGTSLPELVTSVVAALKKQPDLSVGNIVGSNIINVFLVLGVSASIAPLPFSSGAMFDSLFCVFITMLLFLSMFVGRRHMLERWQGVGLVVLYCLFIGYSVIQGRI